MNSLNFLRQKKSIILFMYFNRVELYVWTKKSLELIGNFGNQPDENFFSHLEDYKTYPVIIVTDYLEESFRHDTAVHTYGRDRNALLERKLNYSFRNTPYRSATVIGRDPDGRKDDKILLSALTKPEMLESWVHVLLEEKMQIQSVTSAAYLMQAYSQNAGMSDQYTMIVSIDEGSELRQTFISKGKIQFSRLTSLTTKESAALPDAINHESQQIRQYLERIKLLPFESQMVVRVFSPFHIDDAALAAYNNELNIFYCFNINELADSYSLTVDGLDRSPATLFLSRILQRAVLKNTYAPINVSKFYQLHRLVNGLATTSICLVILTVAMKASGLITTFENWDSTDNLQSLTAPLNRQYDQLTQDFPDTPIPSAEMALVVETAEHITQNAYYIEDAMTVISQALRVAPELQLTGITWELAVRENAPDEQQVQMFGMPSPTQQSGEQAIQNAILEDRTQINITINGLANSPQSYTQAHNQVLYFLNALQSLPGINVTNSMMPTDVRVDANVSTLVDNDALRAPFTLELEMVPVK